MKKVTIIGLGGAGINFLNYLKKKELDNLDLKLLPLEDENFDKNLILPPIPTTFEGISSFNSKTFFKLSKMLK